MAGVGREGKQPERPGEDTTAPQGLEGAGRMLGCGLGRDMTAPQGLEGAGRMLRCRPALALPGWARRHTRCARLVCPLQVLRPLSPVPSLCPLRGAGSPTRAGSTTASSITPAPGARCAEGRVNERTNGQRRERAHGRSSSLPSLPEDPPPCDLGPSRCGPELEGFWGGCLPPPPTSEGPQAPRLKPFGLGFRDVDAPQGDRSHCLESALPWCGPALMHAGRFPALRPALHPRAQVPQSSPGMQLIWGQVTSPKCSEVSNCSLGTPLPLLKCRMAPGGALRYQQQVC